MAIPDRLPTRPNNEESENIPPPPSVDLVRYLKNMYLIASESPHWWSIDYLPDPREYVPIDRFLQNLVPFGQCRCSTYCIPSGTLPMEVYQKNVFLYPSPTVPMTVITLDIEGNHLPFLVSARPYHIKEKEFDPYTDELENYPTIEALRDFVQQGGILKLPRHFYPHIRGLFGGRRGTHFFYYPVTSGGFRQVRDALDGQQMDFIDLFSTDNSRDDIFTRAWEEITGGPRIIVSGKIKRLLEYNSQPMSAEELLSMKEETYRGSYVLYPLRLSEFTHTLPLVITKRCLLVDKKIRPLCVGVMAYKKIDRGHFKGGLLMFTDPELALRISTSLSEDFGTPVDTLLYQPQRGKSIYRRISV